MNVNIKNQEITLKSTFRSMVAYEQITHQMFNPKTFTDMMIYFYSVIISSKAKDSEEITFDDFLDWLDENPSLMTEFSIWVQNISENEKIFQGDEKKTTKRKTKVTQ